MDNDLNEMIWNRLVSLDKESVEYKILIRAYGKIKDLESIMHFIAIDQIELSHEKIKEQRDEWRKAVRKVL